MLPLNYRRWQSKTYLYVQKLLRDAYGGSRSDHRAITGLPFEKATVEIQFIGSHLGDLDNLAGALLDVMTKTNILRDDRISCIPKLILSHEPGETCGAWVRATAMVGAVANKAKSHCEKDTAVNTTLSCVAPLLALYTPCLHLFVASRCDKYLCCHP